MSQGNHLIPMILRPSFLHFCLPETPTVEMSIFVENAQLSRGVYLLTMEIIEKIEWLSRKKSVGPINFSSKY
jgi:hypothetical protein